MAHSSIHSLRRMLIPIGLLLVMLFAGSSIAVGGSTVSTTAIAPHNMTAANAPLLALRVLTLIQAPMPIMQSDGGSQRISVCTSDSALGRLVTTSEAVSAITP